MSGPFFKDEVRRDAVILEKREKVRTETMKMRSELNRLVMLEALPRGLS
jgi:hypothetical protein